RAAPTPGHERMLAVMADIAARADAENPFVGKNAAVTARAQLEALPAGTPPPQRWQALCRTATQELRLGNERGAIECLEQAVALADQVRGSVRPGAIHETKYRLGVACIRFGETENCCQRGSPESCILPIQAGGQHDREEGSRRAIQHFTELLSTVSPASPLGLKSRWLLNIAYMTLGEWPAQVPANWVIPPSVFASQDEFPRFPNVARKLGVDAFNLAGGAIGEDFDGDGDLDILTSTWDPRGPMHYFVNEGAAGFVDRTEEAGLSGLFGGLNMVQADYDNDGNTDVLVLRGAWLGMAGRHPKSLLRNRGDGTFEDVTFAAGLGERAFPTQTASWADYDLDGDLDLYVGAESTIELDIETFPQGGRERMREPCELFRNEGDGTLVDVAAAAGVENLRFTKGVVWGDYDEDRYPDLYVSNLAGENRLYHNRGDGTFEDVAPRLGVTGPRASFPAWFWDYDNDGDRDLYVALFDGSSEALANEVASYLGAKMREGYSACLYRNDGGRFTEVAAEQGID
ncbi:MAG: FG-GAP repeat domain-containing protein, partial [bacterium]